jgi:hypothetical protein
VEFDTPYCRFPNRHPGGYPFKKWVESHQIISGSEADPGSQSEDSDFPISRLKSIPNPRPPILPEYQPDTTEFNFEMLSLFYSLVIFHLPAATDTVALSPASHTVAQALESEKPSPMFEHIVRKFSKCHSQFLDLTAEPVLSRIAQFHNELVFTSVVFHHHQIRPSLTNSADMLLAETYALFKATFENKVNEEY